MINSIHIHQGPFSNNTPLRWGAGQPERLCSCGVPVALTTPGVWRWHHGEPFLGSEGLPSLDSPRDRHLDAVSSDLALAPDRGPEASVATLCPLAPELGQGAAPALPPHCQALLALRK